MNNTPRLVVDFGNFIVATSKVLGLLHNSCGGLNDIPMHVFNHFPASGTKLMFM
jgi:hypothetical protein